MAEERGATPPPGTAHRQLFPYVIEALFIAAHSPFVRLEPAADAPRDGILSARRAILRTPDSK